MTRFTQKLIQVTLIAVTLIFITPASFAHVVETNQIGMVHVASSLTHTLLFALLGILTSILTASRNLTLTYTANFSLFGLLTWQAYLHTEQKATLVGIEFFVAAALIALLTWRASNIIILRFSKSLKASNLLVHHALKYVDRYFRFPQVNAHCDIPCKIYDPAIATISALSVIRLIDIINEEEAAENRGSIESQNTIARCIQRKEEESERLKQEIRIIWGDYFKEPQIEKFPDIHQIAHEIMNMASATKQQVDREKACLLLEAVNRFSEIFWASKDTSTERKQAPYPPHLEIVRPK